MPATQQGALTLPKQDITGRAVTRATHRLNRIRARIAAELPLGPTKATVTRKEAQDNFMKANPAERDLIGASMGGTDIALEVLSGKD